MTYTEAELRRAFDHGVDEGDRGFADQPEELDIAFRILKQHIENRRMKEAAKRLAPSADRHTTREPSDAPSEVRPWEPKVGKRCEALWHPSGKWVPAVISDVRWGGNGPDVKSYWVDMDLGGGQRGCGWKPLEDLRPAPAENTEGPRCDGVDVIGKWRYYCIKPAGHDGEHRFIHPETTEAGEDESKQQGWDGTTGEHFYA